MNKILYIYALLLGRPFFLKLNRLIYSFSLRSLGIFNYQNTKVSGEQWLLANVIKKLGTNLVVFDVGANVGAYSTQLLKLGVKAKQIYAFEPHPATYIKLQGAALGTQILPVKAALSDSVCVTKLYDRSGGVGTSHASLSSEIFSEIHRVDFQASDVHVTTLDEFCKSNNVKNIDFLKIDVEGYELNVLRGAANILSERSVRVIQFEFTQLNAVLRVFFRDFYDLLAKDYDIYRLLPYGLQTISTYEPSTCEIFGYQNFVAILRS
jgi:FkbM family methyltransferase